MTVGIVCGGEGNVIHMMVCVCVCVSVVSLDSHFFLKLRHSMRGGCVTVVPVPEFHSARSTY